MEAEREKQLLRSTSEERSSQKACERLWGCDDESAYYYVGFFQGSKPVINATSTLGTGATREITTQPWSVAAHDYTFGIHTKIERKSKLEAELRSFYSSSEMVLYDTQIFTLIPSQYWITSFVCSTWGSQSLGPDSIFLKNIIRKNYVNYIFSPVNNHWQQFWAKSLCVSCVCVPQPCKRMYQRYPGKTPDALLLI